MSAPIDRIRGFTLVEVLIAPDAAHDPIDRYGSNASNPASRSMSTRSSGEGPARGVPYDGIENLRPESKAAVQEFMYMMQTPKI